MIFLYDAKRFFYREIALTPCTALFRFVNIGHQACGESHCFHVYPMRTMTKLSTFSHVLRRTYCEYRELHIVSNMVVQSIALFFKIWCVSWSKIFSKSDSPFFNQGTVRRIVYMVFIVPLISRSRLEQHYLINFNTQYVKIVVFIWFFTDYFKTNVIYIFKVYNTCFF